MWKKAVDRERKSIEFQKIAENTAADEEEEVKEENPEVLEKKSNEFNKILEVSPEERDRIQRMQVIDRAAAAIAAARALLQENPVPQKDSISGELKANGGGAEENQQQGKIWFVHYLLFFLFTAFFDILYFTPCHMYMPIQKFLTSC